jgi:phosphoribosylamine--glycine ligase
MGSVSPVPFCTKDFMKKVENKIIIPTINGLQKEKISYQGFIFLGLMNVNGNPYVIEYNVRMGDPETESVFPRIKSDIVEAFELIGKKKLCDYSLEIDSRVATTVMLVSGGYPQKYAKGKPISGLNDLNNCIAFHAGTKRNDKDEIVTNGGRVLALTCFGKDMNEALNKCYENAKRISWQDVYYRKDIGKDLMKY